MPNEVNIDGTTQPISKIFVELAGGQRVELNVAGLEPPVSLPKVSPVVMPLSQSFSGSSFSVPMSTSPQDAEIRYTLDDSTPTRQSPLYTTPLSLTNTDTVKAIGILTGYLDSDVTTRTYTKTVTPVPLPTGGNANFSAPELAVVMDCWAQKPGNKNFYNFGDSFTNSPNEGKEKEDRARSFFANPAAYHWHGPRRWFPNGGGAYITQSETDPSVPANHRPAHLDAPEAELYQEPQYSRGWAGVELYCASEAYVCKPTVYKTTANRQAIVTALLRQLNAPKLDFRNATAWAAFFKGDENPKFFIAAFMWTICRVRNNMYSDMTSEERRIADSRLFCWAWFMHDFTVNGYRNNMFVAPDGERGTFATRRKCYAAKQYGINGAVWDTYDNNFTHQYGWNNTRLVHGHSNRTGAMLLAPARAMCSFVLSGHNVDPAECYRYTSPDGGLTKNKITSAQGTALYSSGSTTSRLPAFSSRAAVNECINLILESGELFMFEHNAFGMYPDGTSGEFYRGTSANRELGFNYAGVALADHTFTAYMYARIGRHNPMRETTRIGRLDTVVPPTMAPKGLLTYCQNICRLYRRATGIPGFPDSPSPSSKYGFKRYLNGFTTGDENILDGQYLGTYYIFDSYSAPVVLYYRLAGLAGWQELKDTYTRNKAVYPSVRTWPSIGNGGGSNVGPMRAIYGGFAAWAAGYFGQFMYADEKIGVSDYSKIYPASPLQVS